MSVTQPSFEEMNRYAKKAEKKFTRVFGDFFSVNFKSEPIIEFAKSPRFINVLI